MRWQSRDWDIDDTRTVTRFAFLPTRINADTVVWLERYTVTERLVIHGGLSDGYWRAWETVNESPEAAAVRAIAEAK